MDSIKKRISDRIYRIIWIEGPSAQDQLAAGEKNLYPACPAKREACLSGVKLRRTAQRI
jgi:hypothetical protein